MYHHLTSFKIMMMHYIDTYMPIFQYPYVSVYIPRGNLMLSLMFGWVRPRVVGFVRGRRFQEQLQDLQEQLEAARLQAVDDVGVSWKVMELR